MAGDRHSFLTPCMGFGEIVTLHFRRLAGRGHVPSRACPVLDTVYGAWENGKRSEGISIGGAIGVPH